jgi:hypothetical protein
MSRTMTLLGIIRLISASCKVGVYLTDADTCNTHEGVKSASAFLVGEPKRKRLFQRPRLRWKTISKMTRR